MGNTKRKNKGKEKKKRDVQIYHAYLRCVPITAIAEQHDITIHTVYKTIKEQRRLYQLDSEMVVDCLISCKMRINDAYSQLKQIEELISQRDDVDSADSKIHQLHDSATKLRKVIHDEQKFEAELLAQLTNDTDAAARYQEELAKLTDNELEEEIEKLK